MRGPVTEWEEREKQRQEAIKDHLEDIKAVTVDVTERPSSELRSALTKLQALVISEDTFAEYAGAAEELRETAIARLNERIATAVKREAEAAELAEFRALKAKDEQAERDERLRQEGIKAANTAAEAKAKREAEDEAKRKADEEHVRAVNRTARDALVSAGIDAKVAQKVVELIIRNKVPRVSIAY
ncbi:MAG TPA: hypothetical protein PKD49_07665 [Hyphomicrobium sp.]|nr:hypothetical protein [Hyphomicrobium sp.]